MKLIIDIPDKTIAHIRADYGHCITGLYDEDREIIVKAIYNGKPLQTEFEEIKAEISKLTRYYTTESGNINLVSDNAVYRIINKHISELKGE